MSEIPAECTEPRIQHPPTMTAPRWIPYRLEAEEWGLVFPGHSERAEDHRI